AATTTTDDEEEDEDMEDYYSQRNLARLRQNSEDNSRQLSSGLENDTIARFSKESLYSYSFNPAFLRSHGNYNTNKTAINKTSRKHMIQRGVDFVKKIRYKLDDRVTRRFSHPDIGSMTYDWQTNYWSAQNTPRTSIDYDSISQPFFRDGLLQQGDSVIQQQLSYDILNIGSSGGNNSNVLSPTTNSNFSSGGRRQTLPRSSTDQGGTSLPPIYEYTRGSISPNPRSSVAANNSSDDATTTAAETYYKRALHAPTRFLPQNQAIFTTSVNGTILLFNDIASLCFGINKSYIGKTILPILQQPFRKQVETLLSHRKDTMMHNKNSVLVPIVKINGEMSTSSLWLKEKERDGGQVVYIWIFEEICESTLFAHLDSKGVIKDIIGKMQELFGYENDQAIGKPVDVMIPQLRQNKSTEINFISIEQLKFFGAQDKSGAFFPVMTTLHQEQDNYLSLKITSLPAVAGLLTIHHDGIIQSISPVPAKYLFGYQNIEMIVEKMNIDQLLPQFHDILNGLRKDGLWKNNGTSVVGNQACRKALLDSAITVGGLLSQDTERRLSVSSQSNNTLPTIYAVHRDGSHFNVQLQLRSIESAEENLISIWVSFDRLHSESIRRGNSNNKRKASVAQLSSTPLGATNSNNGDNDRENTAIKSKMTPVPPPSSDHGNQDSCRSVSQSLRRIFLPRNNSRKGLEPLEEEEIMRSAPDPISTPIEEDKAIILEQEEQQKHQWPPPLPTDGDKHPLDNYVIESSLGEGSYGTAMLAYCKNDETKKKVVIKSITKSRIIVDSWMRDRRFGDMVPAEIHILRTLKANQHPNCCHLLTHMEDQEYYYVVMELHGDGMDLFDFIELNETISEQEARTIFRQVAEGVRHLHHNKIVHRDIKDENIILDESGTAVLIDFGSAAYYRENKKFETFCGTMDYWAPELLQGISYSGPPQDIWSLGILLYTLIFRETPFNEIDDILGDELRIREPPYPGPTNLLHKMLSRDVYSRPTIDEVLRDPWISPSSSP
ncbi:hypothetical protein INT45_007510, partial [Circinella minor]